MLCFRKKSLLAVCEQKETRKPTHSLKNVQRGINTDSQHIFDDERDRWQFFESICTSRLALFSPASHCRTLLVYHLFLFYDTRILIIYMVVPKVCKYSCVITFSLF